jgi:hypothetical protein
MSAFDATLNVSAIQAIPAGPQDENGKYVEAQLLLGVMTTVPVGPKQLMPIPVGGFRVPLDKGSVDDLIVELQKVSELLKERVHIDVASNLAGVEQAAAQEAKLRNG